MYRFRTLDVTAARARLGAPAAADRGAR